MRFDVSEVEVKVKEVEDSAPVKRARASGWRVAFRCVVGRV